ncbi:glycerophosphodiester phosphodiesterase family protein [Candidatus Pelagibacter sp.]|jgi:glycerophosphoryl diester phosphodiesterase|nr:glycerophosphodiester phosphodiesterase family protein [Candidatus Pelagibacter sp.]|tara:strand:- start:71 stop:712 length:642 start_codon:yes stop_codon:yes gene_type:complete
MHLIHRGIINKNFKENLLNSFQHSFKKGYGIETDIHATKDNQFICFHDFTLKRIFKKNLSVKNLNYSQINDISTKLNKPIPLLKDLLRSSNNKHALFIEIKPLFSKLLLEKLIKETSKFTQCVFISFKHENIFSLLKIKKKTKVGLSFSPPTSIKKIIQKSNNKNINCLILDKSYLKNKNIQNLKIKKYFYTIKTKSEFCLYKKNNNLIFENL